MTPLEQFKIDVETDIEKLHEERFLTDDYTFSYNHGISMATVRKFMGKRKKRVYPTAEYINELRENMSDSSIIGMLKIGGDKLMEIAGKRKFKYYSKVKNLTKEEIKKIQIMFFQGFSGAKIAKEIGCSPTSVYKHKLKKKEEFIEKEKEPELKMGKWEYTIEEKYWDEGEVVNIGTRPLPGVKLDKNTYGYTYF